MEIYAYTCSENNFSRFFVVDLVLFYTTLKFGWRLITWFHRSLLNLSSMRKPVNNVKFCCHIHSYSWELNYSFVCLNICFKCSFLITFSSRIRKYTVNVLSWNDIYWKIILNYFLGHEEENWLVQVKFRFCCCSDEQ